MGINKQSRQNEQLYIRFGDIPPNEKSKIYRGEEIGYENGVSVYPAFELASQGYEIEDTYWNTHRVKIEEFK